MHKLLLPAVFGLVLASSASAQELKPFVYHEGKLVWERNRWLEDHGDTVLVLSGDLVDLDPTHDQKSTIGSTTLVYPEMLVFNQAQFTPPEGEPAGPGERRLNEESIDRKGLQLYVNYGDAKVDPGGASTKRYDQGMFFISLSTNGLPVNAQPLIPVPALPFSGVTISASGGVIDTLVKNGVTYDAIYVTASVGYDPASLANASYAAAAAMDRLFLKAPAGDWIDASDLIPSSVRATNNSGVAIANLDTDSDDEIYVGVLGVDFEGAPDVILDFNPTTGLYQPNATLLLNAPARATTSVAAADFNADQKIDVVVACRSPRSDTATPQETNYVLLNNGPGLAMTKVDLPPASGMRSDSRSVAVGNIGGNGKPEIVFGNAGNNGFDLNVEYPPADDDPMQVWTHTQAAGFVDVTFPVSGFPAFGEGAIYDAADERKWTTGLTFQVLLQDIVTPTLTDGEYGCLIEKDGLLDLIVVNHRDALQQDDAVMEVASPSNVQILGNVSTLGGALGIFQHVKTLDIDWAKSVCFTNYVYFKTFAGEPGTDPFVTANLEDPLGEDVEPFVGTGNRFAGTLNRIFRAVGNSWFENASGQEHFDTTYDTIPGNERGYGFDFARSGVFGPGVDAIQTSRGYQFLTVDMLDKGNQANPAWARHWDLTSPYFHGEFGLPGPYGEDSLYYRRGMSVPIGAEDGCFVDLDDDPELELVVVGQSAASRSHPDPDAGASVVSVLDNTAMFSYSQERTLRDFVDDVHMPLPITQEHYVDDKINLNGRDAAPTARNADRVQAADLDNDGDVDVMVSLFPTQYPEHGGYVAGHVYDMTAFDMPHAELLYGFMYLENRFGTPGETAWLKDVTNARMHDDASGTFHSEYNRARGDIALADLDGNGAIDLFSVQTPSKVVDPPEEEDHVDQVDEYRQLRELIFLNGIKGDPVGQLREMSATIFPNGAAPDIAELVHGHATPQGQTSGGSSVDWGDVDNDGDVDLLVTRGGDNYPGLLLNDGASGENLSFDDVFTTRVPIASLDGLIPSLEVQTYDEPPQPLPGLDGSGQGRFIDIDGDGDLDIILTVPSHTLRILENKGTDNNEDGFIDARDLDPLDPEQLGYFADRSSTWQSEYRVVIDGTDSQVVDIDQDGDYDFAIDGWWDQTCFWRNETPMSVGPLGIVRPHVTEVWPRIGAIRGSTVTLRGDHLKFPFPSNVVTIVALTYKNLGAPTFAVANPTSDPHELIFTIPANAPVGFARIHVVWVQGSAYLASKQYVGYCVLSN